MYDRGRLARAAPYALMLLLGAIEPLTHASIQFYPPAGAAPTGLHTGDSGHHLAAMDSFGNGFTSPFVTCKAPGGASDFRYFAVPIFLLYGIVGEVGRMLGMPPFLFLGIVNGLGGALLLWCVYRFMRRIAPKEALPAFYLYAVGGGLGGAAFLASWLFGGLSDPGFEAWFYRFAEYELIEGQHLTPLLLMPRFYYTLPMALGFAALTAFVETDWRRCPGHLFFTSFLLFITACINLRLGPLFWGIGAAYLLLGSKNDARYRLWLAASTLAPVAAGSAVFLWLMRLHPSYQHNVSGITPSCMLLAPLLLATVFHWPPVLALLRHLAPGLSRPVRTAVLGMWGYVAVYALFYFGHQAWYGNWWRGGDMAAAVLASDWALPGVAPALVLAWRWQPRPASGAVLSPALTWVLLWFTVLFVVSMLAVGQGWFLRFAPQRGMVLLGVPLALLAAAGLRCLPKWGGRACFVLIIAGGVLSQVVAALYYQGPLARTPGTGPFAYLHYEFMTEADGRLLAQLPPGTVAVPPWSPIAFGEVVARNGEHQVLGGPGAMNLGDQKLGPLQEAINHFFRADTDEVARQAFVREWCVDYVYCPDTCLIDPAVADQFRAIPWMPLVAEAGRGMVFAVTGR